MEEKNLLEVVQVFMDAVPNSEPGQAGLANDLRGQAGVISVRGVSGELTNQLTNLNEPAGVDEPILGTVTSDLTGVNTVTGENQSLPLESGDSSHVMPQFGQAPVAVSNLNTDGPILQEDDNQIIYHPSILVIQDIAHIARHVAKANSIPHASEEDGGTGQEFAITRHHISFLVLNPFMCSICGQVFGTTKILGKHVFEEHGLKGIDMSETAETQTDIVGSIKRSEEMKVGENEGVVQEETKEDFENNVKSLDSSSTPGDKLVPSLNKNILRPAEPSERIKTMKCGPSENSVDIIRKMVYSNTYPCFICYLDCESEEERDVHMGEKHKDEMAVCDNCKLVFDFSSWGKYVSHVKECTYWNGHNDKMGTPSPDQTVEKGEAVPGKRKRGRPPKHLAKRSRGRPKGSKAKSVKIVPEKVSVFITKRSNRAIKLPGRYYSYEVQKASGEKIRSLGENEEEHSEIDEDENDAEYRFPSAALKYHGLKEDAAKKEKKKLKVVKEKQIFKCEFCPEEFNWKILRGQHRLTAHKDEKFECGFCNKTFPVDKRAIYLQHLRCHTKPKQDRVPSICTVCGKSFRLSSSLTNHMRIHPGYVDDREMEFCCETCGKRFATVANLQSHQKVHSDERPYTCTLCNSSFKVKSYLELHMRRHTGEKPHKCDYCDEHFSAHVAKRKHETFHTNELLYICSYCDKKFRTSSQLNVHKRIHTQVKPYTCQVPDCGKSFRSNDTLAVHSRTHTGIKPFQCSHCGQEFAQKINMIHHERSIHTGEKPYRCDICEKRFSRSNRLKAHQEKDHKVVKEMTVIETGAEWLPTALPTTVTIHETVSIANDAEEAVRTLQSLAGTVINIVEV